MAEDDSKIRGGSEWQADQRDLMTNGLELKMPFNGIMNAARNHLEMRGRP
jgi:hypothetical protein